MWTRKELKERGQSSFKRNYWKAVLVALFLSLVAGGFSGGGYTGSFPSAYRNHTSTGSSIIEEHDTDEADDADDADDADNEDKMEITIEPDENGDLKMEATEGLIGAVNEMDKGAFAVAGIALVVIFLVLFAIIMVFAFAFSAFLLNPIEMGCDRFFLKNLDDKVNVSENVLYGFDNSYKNIVRNMFFRDLYAFLWSLLFIIPGIVKSYEYRMIPYLLAENPDMTKEEVFAKSKEMMMGQKWKAFVLDLSFIGWDLLSVCTCGILSVLFVDPYKCATRAALYDTLRVKETPEIEMTTEAYTDAL